MRDDGAEPHRRRRETSDESLTVRRALAITIALIALIWIGVVVRYAPPAPAPKDAPKERFSAERARAFQERLVGDGATRWIGTEGNERGRKVIAAELERIGWTVEEQRARACTRYGMCAAVTNVVAHLPGRDPSLPGVLLTAHHDSVPVNPGASDDGAGTAAIVETARALAEGPRPLRTVVAVLTDAEEAGLLGAEAFVREHPLAKSVRMTVNVDSRGSRGPSQMFETSRGNAWLVSLMARTLERPVTSSLYYEVYKRMPNDTDFTVTRTIAAGVNFANTAAIENYHTPLDTLAVADLGTLQHHGDNVLAMTRAFAESDASATPVTNTDAVWFDVFAFGVVRWPERWTKLFAFLALALVAGRAVRARAFDRGLFVSLSIVAGGLAAFVVGRFLRGLGALPAFWIAHPTPALLAIHAAAAAAVLGVAFALASRSSPRALWAGTWIGWGLLGVGAAHFAAGTSYLFVVPTMAAAVAGFIGLEVACIVPAAVAAVLVLALAPGLYEAVGFVVPPLVALPTILTCSTLAPMLVGIVRPTSRLAPAMLGAVSLVGAIVAVAVPKFSAERPQRVNVVFRQDAGGDAPVAKVFVDNTWGPSTWGTPPAEMLAAIGGAVGREPATPWTLPTPFGSVPPIDAKPPVIDVSSKSDTDGRRRVVGRVRSQRGAPIVALFFPGSRRVEVKVEGTYASLRPLPGGWFLGFPAAPAEGVAVEIDASGPAPIDVMLLDRTQGVPPGTSAEAAVKARPPTAVPFQDGDVTIVTWRGNL